MSKNPRKLLATADLHLGLYPVADAGVFELARRVCASDADIFVIAGDLADTGEKKLRTCLRLFERFEGLKLLVPGNHDLWTTSGDSEEKYRTVLPRIARNCGFHMLDVEPVTAAETAFIGTIGWYDYSLRSPRLALSTETYRRKSLPGVCTWNDALYINWNMEDEDFTDRCLRQLGRHYDAVESKVERVVAVLHHLPFAELLSGHVNMPLDFCRAYMGSARFGELLVRCPKVRFVICGHQHAAVTHQQGALKAFALGGEYRKKRLLSLDIETGKHEYADFPSGGSSGERQGQTSTR